MNNGIAPEILAFGRQVPHIFASYTDGNQKENPYIYNPLKPTQAYVSPRSLERASNIIKVRDQLDADSVIAALSGAIGESAARDMQAYLEFSDQLPTKESLQNDPDHAIVPTAPGALAVLCYSMINSAEKDTFSKTMKYVVRLPAEFQAIFCIGVAKNPKKQAIAFSNVLFAKWAADNQDLL
jgi:hypothetical protein